MKVDELKEQLDQAELVLVGLGEEFDAACGIKDVREFQRGRDILQNGKANWLLPAWGEFCACRLGTVVNPALDKLKSILEGKNHFVVSVSVNSHVASVFGDSQKLVMPCGNVRMKQCKCACGEELHHLTKEDRAILEDLFQKLWEGSLVSEVVPYIGSCSRCGSPMILNNVYAEKYDESGYQEDWQRYTKWLQGTLNHKLLLLELGVSMGFPSVIRAPFERITAYNQKAFLYRVNEKLSQLPADLLSKGVGISKNAIDWLSQL